MGNSNCNCSGMEGKKAQLQEGVKLSGSRDARHRRTSCKGMKFALVMR